MRQKQAHIEPRQEAESREGRVARVSLLEGVLTVRVSKRSDEDQGCEIDLNNVWLPATVWAPDGTKLVDRSDLRDLLVNAVRVFHRRNGETKSTAVVTGDMVRTLCKFMEYGWLCGCYESKDWKPVHTKRLIEELASGGWEQALQLEERTSRWLATQNRVPVETLFNADGGLRDDGLAVALRTNARRKMLTPALKPIGKAMGDVSLGQGRKGAIRPKAGASVTMLRQTMNWINLLADVPGGLSFTPYETVTKTAVEQGGAPMARTKNISPGEVGLLLKEAFKWIYSHAPMILALFEELTDALERERPSDRERNAFVSEQLRTSRVRVALDQSIGARLCATRVRGAKDDEVGIQNLAQALFDACFIVIGFMNARRADEIQHRKVGIYHDALALFDARLGLYECDFYLEKYRKGYKRFFVNACTVDAIKVMQQMSAIAVRLRVSAGKQHTGAGAVATERKITQIPRFNHLMSESAEWFSFNAGPSGLSRYFFQRAVGGDVGWHLRPHMLRRAYALIYLYRYEDGELLALSDQLDHFTADNTLQYVTESSVPDGRVPLTAFGRVSEEERKLLEQESESVRREVEAAQHEKMLVFVESVITGVDRTSGGLAKLLRRFHAKLATRIDYSALSSQQQASTLAAAVQGRGQRLRPYRHGDCGAPEEAAGKGLGRCYDEDAKSLDRSRATPILCHKCPYHRASKGHLLGLQQELTWLLAHVEQVPKNSLMRQTRVVEIRDLEYVIDFHSRAIDS